MESFLAALAGGLIAGAASVITMIVQTRSEHRRAKARRAIEAAVADQQSVLEHGRPGRVAPLAAWMVYYRRMEDLLEKDSPIDPDQLRRIDEEVEAIVEVAQDMEGP